MEKPQKTIQKQNPPKRQHVIPKCYLKRFADQDKAWVIDLDSDSLPYRTNLNNMLCVKDFYTTNGPQDEKSYDLEDWLCRGETQAEPVLSRLLDQMKIPQKDDKSNLAFFLATLYLRGPFFRRLQLELYESTLTWFRDFYYSEDKHFDEVYNSYKSKHGPNALDREFARKVLNESKIKGYIATEGYIATMFHSLPRLTAIFNNMDITVWWGNPSEKMRFITGDFPFVFEDKSIEIFTWPTYGLMDKRVRIYIPISPLVCIILEYNGLETVLPITNTYFIPIVNSQLGISMSRYIVSRNQDLYWFKGRKTYSSINEFHNEFKAAKKDQPLVRVNGGEIEVTPRPAWGKLKGYKQKK